MLKKSINLFIFAAALLALPGCYYDKADLLYPAGSNTDCASNPAKYSTDVSPIIQSKCATSGCHDAATAAGGAVLESYTEVSALAARINQRSIVEKTMPAGTPLTATEINILSCWISSGTPNN